MLLRVRAEAKLRTLNQALEQRIAERTQALESANARLEVLSRTDALTGLANRRALDEWLWRELGRAQRTGSPISVLALDVDHFKPYNDTLGHQAGDDCLVQLAGLMQAVCRRSTDLAVRTGGEEFLILLPDISLSEAKRLGNELRKSLHDAHIPHPASAVGDRITLSIGLACTIPTQPAQDLLKCADAALYRAKAQGRNRLETIDE